MEFTTDTYRSIAAESRAVFRDKASRFIAVAFPVESEEEVKHCLDELRKQYYDANHHCYAYRLGLDKQHYRANDDGEPSGSAGKPIYGQILSLDLSDVLVVVVRYFGGTKLGVPGLINAYKTVTREALEQSIIVEKTVQSAFSVTFDYPLMNEVMRVIKEEGAKIVRQDAGERCVLGFQIRRAHAERIAERFSRIRNAALTTD